MMIFLGFYTEIISLSKQSSSVLKYRLLYYTVLWLKNHKVSNFSPFGH